MNSKSKNKFKVGDRVKISKSSGYYSGDKTSSNPKDVVGTVTNYEKESGFTPDDFTTSVDWDNGTNNTYSDKDLELVAAAPLTVDKEFVMQAYESACSTWKEKIEQQFPELFPKQKFATLTTQTPGTSTLYYKTQSGTYKSLEYNVALIDAIAGQLGVPKEARYKGIYVNNRGGNIDNLEVINTGDGFAILFNIKN